MPVGFEEGVAAGGSVEELAYVGLRGGTPPVTVTPVAPKEGSIDELAGRAFERLVALLGRDIGQGGCHGQADQQPAEDGGAEDRAQLVRRLRHGARGPGLLRRGARQDEIVRDRLGGTDAETEEHEGGDEKSEVGIGRRQRHEHVPGNGERERRRHDDAGIHARRDRHDDVYERTVGAGWMDGCLSACDERSDETSVNRTRQTS